MNKLKSWHFVAGAIGSREAGGEQAEGNGEGPSQRSFRL